MKSFMFGAAVTAMLAFGAGSALAQTAPAGVPPNTMTGTGSYGAGGNGPNRPELNRPGVVTGNQTYYSGSSGIPSDAARGAAPGTVTGTGSYGDGGNGPNKPTVPVR